MKINQIQTICAFMALSATYACIDNDYDLSDIDTTARVNVDNLVVPVNIDRIDLKSIIDIDENNPDNNIKVIGNKYTYLKDGTFNTSGISVAAVQVPQPTVPPVDVAIDIPSQFVGKTLPTFNFTVAVPQKETSFSFNSGSISDDIHDIERIGGEMTGKLVLNLTGATSFIGTYDIKDLRIQLPKSLILSESADFAYDSENRVITISRNACGGSIEIPLVSKGIYTADCFDSTTHSLTVDGKVGIIDGTLSISTVDNATVPSEIGITLTASFSAMTADSFDGIITYDIKNVNVPDINITDLPDVLSQAGTNLLLKSPQLLLSFNNPVSECGLTARSGFVIKAYHGETATAYEIDDKYFNIPAAPVAKYCFAPAAPGSDDANAEYTPNTFVKFTGLESVLSGDGLPGSLAVELPGLSVPLQRVNGFKLGYDYGDIAGKYRFVAPLQFAEGSVIVYSDKIDGWADEELDHMTVTALTVKAKVSTDVPVAIAFTGNPIDAKGNIINNVSIEGAEINANANNQELTLRITGEISGLDGIKFRAVATAVSGAALSPDMHITLTDVRPCVSGYYEKEL